MRGHVVSESCHAGQEVHVHVLERRDRRVGRYITVVVVATSPHDDHCALASSVVSAASTFPLLRFDFDVTSGVQQTVQESVRGTGTVGFLLSFYTLVSLLKHYRRLHGNPVCTPSLLSKGRAPLQLYELL